MKNTPWYVLTCPECGRKQIYVGTGLYKIPACFDCGEELKPSTQQSIAQKLAVIAHNPPLQDELGARIQDYMYEDSVTEETMGRAVADVGYAAITDVGHNSSYSALNMFGAIVGTDLDNIIDMMNPVPYQEDDFKF